MCKLTFFLLLLLMRTVISFVQNAAEGTNVYSTPNSNWEVLESFKGGQVLEMDIVMNAYHWVSFYACHIFYGVLVVISCQQVCGRFQR